MRFRIANLVSRLSQDSQRKSFEQVGFTHSQSNRLRSRGSRNVAALKWMSDEQINQLPGMRPRQFDDVGDSLSRLPKKKRRRSGAEPKLATPKEPAAGRNEKKSSRKLSGMAVEPKKPLW